MQKAKANLLGASSSNPLISSRHDYASTHSSQQDAVIATLSKLINDHSDTLEKMVSEKIVETSMKIEGLKKTVDFVCNELKDTQKKVEAINTCLKEKEGIVERLKARSEELKNYIRWILQLYGVDEDQMSEKRTDYPAGPWFWLTGRVNAACKGTPPW
ncbi:hypothetical protein CRENBAI_006205 [Crenichthys baileyi]|uniref:Uncharacterized protein n=1 Tax=Crenichthys baileyi TaxID=28760 RepID=A0AAV9RZ13_9TELE